MVLRKIKQRKIRKVRQNELAEGKKKNPFILFWSSTKDFLVIILIIAAIISGVLGDIESAIVIFVVITINAILGTVQHIKAEQSLDSLKRNVCTDCKRLSVTVK